MFSITYRLGDFEVVLSADTVEDVLALDDAYGEEDDDGWITWSGEEDDDGWITWSGGECPFDKDTTVTVRFRSGMEQMINTSKAWCWNHANIPSDIVAYKVVK